MTEGSARLCTTRVLALAALALAGALSFTLVHPAAVSAAPQAANATVEMPDPASITFKVRITADADIASATLNYKVLNPDGNVGGSLRAEAGGGRTVDASVQLLTNNNDRYIPVGTQVTYSWTAADKNGATTTTPEQTFVFLDGRYQWQSKTDRRVTIYWYGAAEANADLALNAVASSITANLVLLNVRSAVAAPTPPTGLPPTGKVVAVQPGDVAWRIALQAGIALADLIQLNPKEPRSGDWNLIHPGEILVLEAPPLVLPTPAGPSVLDYPVRVVLWRNSADAKAAQRPRASTFDQQVITGGSRVATDVLHIYDPLGGFVDVARHEAAHIVTKVAGDGPFSTIPSWLDEGTAVYAQNSPGGYEPAVKRAIARDEVTRLRSMASPTNLPAQVDIFYGESWAVVKFMVDTYGKEKFAAVFKTVKDGAAIDEALEKTIGVDQDGLYNAWRKSVGLKTIDYPPVPKATSIAAAQATQRPLGIPTSVTSAENTSGGGGAGQSASTAAVSPATAVAVGAGTLVVAAVLGFLAVRLLRKQ